MPVWNHRVHAADRSRRGLRGIGETPWSCLMFLAAYFFSSSRIGIGGAVLQDAAGKTLCVFSKGEICSANSRRKTAHERSSSVGESTPATRPSFKTTTH